MAINVYTIFSEYGFQFFCPLHPKRSIVVNLLVLALHFCQTLLEEDDCFGLLLIFVLQLILERKCFILPVLDLGTKIVNVLIVGIVFWVEARKDLQEKQKAWDEEQRKMQSNINELEEQNDNME